MVSLGQRGLFIPEFDRYTIIEVLPVSDLASVSVNKFDVFCTEIPFPIFTHFSSRYFLFSQSIVCFVTVLFIAVLRLSAQN